MSRFDAVIFDMDGTLIEQRIDFAALRAELDVPEGMGIIEAIAQMSPADQAAANATLVEREVAAAHQANLMAGADGTLAAIRSAGLKTALLTRNGPEALEVIFSRFDLPFDLAWTRDQGPIKPEPDGVLRACRELGVRPARTACVGDFRYDIEAANAAGAVSVLLTGGLSPGFADEADYVIDRLPELCTIVGL
ncbi:MAG: HAD family hydrolase [Planctomycetota bacterium]|jgi:HAD superfamily hydrolase (TIGR01509 family)